MVLVPVIAWIAAVLVAAVLLGFCGYELLWKSKRLRRDLGELQTLSGQLSELQTQITATQERLSATRAG